MGYQGVIYIAAEGNEEDFIEAFGFDENMPEAEIKFNGTSYDGYYYTFWSEYTNNPDNSMVFSETLDGSFDEAEKKFAEYRKLKAHLQEKYPQFDWYDYVTGAHD